MSTTLETIRARLRSAKARHAEISEEIAGLARAAIAANAEVPGSVTKLSAERDRLRLEIETLQSAEASELEAERERQIAQARADAADHWAASVAGHADLIAAAGDVERAIDELLSAVDRAEALAGQVRASAIEASAGVRGGPHGDPVMQAVPFNAVPIIEGRTGDLREMRLARARASGALSDAVSAYLSRYEATGRAKLAEVLAVPEAAE